AALLGPTGPGTIFLQNSTVTANGLGANGLFISGAGSSISLINSNVVSSRGNGALVDNGASLTLAGATITALIHWDCHHGRHRGRAEFHSPQRRKSDYGLR